MGRRSGVAGRTASIVLMQLLAALCGLVPQSCVTTKVIPIESGFRPLPSGLTADDSTRFATESAVIRILDSADWDYDFNAAITRDTFRARADRYITRDSTTWNRAMAGLAWAKDSAHCAGQVWNPQGDVRWNYFIRFGPPSAWWVTDYNIRVPGGGGDTTLGFFYWWDAQDTGLAAVAESTHTWPSATLPLLADQPEPAKPIYPAIDAVSFPNRDGTYDVWVTAAVWGDDLTGATIAGDALGATLNLLGENPSERERLLDTRRQTRELGLAGLVLGVTANRRSLSIPFYFELTGLHAGRYTLEVSIAGGHNNSGGGEKTLILPSPFAGDGTSDLLLVYKHGPRGPGIAPRVHRENRELQGTAFPSFVKGDTISPYVEMYLPPGERWAYTTKVYLERVRVGARGVVSVSKPVVSADSLGAPLFRWAGADLTGDLRKLQQPSQSSRPILDLLYARVDQPERDRAIFESSFQISHRVRPGDYWLIIDFEGRDRTGADITRSVRKRIQITYAFRP